MEGTCELCMDVIEAVANPIFGREVREQCDALDAICPTLFYWRPQADLLAPMEIEWLDQGQQPLAPIVGVRGGDG